MRLIFVLEDVLYIVRAVVRVVLLEDGERGDHGRRAFRVVELCHDVAYPAPVSATDTLRIYASDNLTKHLRWVQILHELGRTDELVAREAAISVLKTEQDVDGIAQPPLRDQLRSAPGIVVSKRPSR